MIIAKTKIRLDYQLFLLIFAIFFVIFIFTTDGHRYTFDEDQAEQQTIRIVTEKPSPFYHEGYSRVNFEYPQYFPNPTGPICKNAIICSGAYIGHSITEVPFVFINNHFHIITNTTVTWTQNDFSDLYYTFWRNNQDPDVTFLELLYGPIFSSLSVGIFYLICRTFDFNNKTSFILTIIYGLATLTWAYSKTSLNVVPVVCFDLLGFLFFRRFQQTASMRYLIWCGLSFGFAFLVRPDTVLFVIPLFLFLVYNIIKQKDKIKKIFSFGIPISLFYGLYLLTDYVRDGTSPFFTAAQSGQQLTSIGYFYTPLQVGVFGLFLSPGVGLFIFCPIILTIFFSFPDFYKRNKAECILFLSFVMFFVIFYGRLPFWHGLVAWGPRYLLSTIPFMILPLGSSIEKRKKGMMFILIPLCILGFFFNVVYMIQDVSWFVWGQPNGESGGLYSLPANQAAININPAIIWSFKFSQLTQSIITMFVNLQPDIFLLKVLGPLIYGLVFATLLALLIYTVTRLLRYSGNLDNSCSIK